MLGSIIVLQPSDDLQHEHPGKLRHLLAGSVGKQMPEPRPVVARRCDDYMRSGLSEFFGVRLVINSLSSISTATRKLWKILREFNRNVGGRDLYLLTIDHEG